MSKRNRFLLLALTNAFFAGGNLALAMIHADQGRSLRVLMSMSIVVMNLLMVVIMVHVGKLGNKSEAEKDQNEAQN